MIKKKVYASSSVFFFLGLAGAFFAAGFLTAAFFFGAAFEVSEVSSFFFLPRLGFSASSESTAALAAFFFGAALALALGFFTSASLTLSFWS